MRTHERLSVIGYRDPSHAVGWLLAVARPIRLLAWGGMAGVA